MLGKHIFGSVKRVDKRTCHAKPKDLEQVIPLNGDKLCNFLINEDPVGKQGKKVCALQKWT